MKIIAQARNYSPDLVKKRYVRFSLDGAFHFAEVGDDRWIDLRQGTVERDELPESVAAAAEAEHKRGQWPSYVEWPL